MGDLNTIEGINAEIRRAADQCTPVQYVPLLLRCAAVRRGGVVDPHLAVEVADYASTLAMHGLLTLAGNLRRAVPA